MTPDPLRAALRERLRITTECLDEALSALRTTQPKMYQDDWRRALSDARAVRAADTAPLDDRPSMPCCANTYGLPVPCQHPPLTYSEADRQAAYKAGWDDARAVIAEPLDVEGYWERAYWRVVPKLAEALAGHVTTRAEINDALANDPRVAVAKERDQG